MLPLGGRPDDAVSARVFRAVEASIGHTDDSELQPPLMVTLRERPSARAGERQMHSRMRSATAAASAMALSRRCSRRR